MWSAKSDAVLLCLDAVGHSRGNFNLLHVFCTVPSIAFEAVPPEKTCRFRNRKQAVAPFHRAARPHAIVLRRQAPTRHRDMCDIELERRFDEAHHSYMENTDERTRDFYELKTKDKLLSSEIDTKIRTIELSQKALAFWKKKLSSNSRECRSRNQTMLDEKMHVYGHYSELKDRMARFRLTKQGLLKVHSMKCREIRQRAEDMAAKAGVLIILSERARKNEAVNEKLLMHDADASFSTLEVDKEEPMEDEIEMMFGKTKEDDENRPGNSRHNSIDQHKLGDGQWKGLENFHRRLNAALLSRTAAQRIRDRVRKQNEQLRSVLRRYLEGINVRDDTLDMPNPLFVVNGKVELTQATRSRRMGQPQIVEAVLTHRHYQAQARISDY